MTGDIQALQFSRDLDRLLRDYVPLMPSTQPAQPPGVKPAGPPRPFGIETITGAARRTIPGFALVENLYAETMDVNRSAGLEAVPGYDVYADPEIRAYVARNPEAFIGVQSPAHAQRVIGRLDRDTQYYADIAASPIMSLLTEMGTSLFDPFLFGKIQAGATFGSRVTQGAAGGFSRGIASQTLIAAGMPEQTIEEMVFGASAFSVINGLTSGAFGRAYKGNVAQAEADAARILGSGSGVVDWQGRHSQTIARTTPPLPPGGSGGGDQFRTVGAAAAADARQVAPGGERLKPAFGLEKLPDTPVRRIMALDEELGQQTVTEIVDLGGMAQVKNADGWVTFQPVEREMTTRYKPQLADAVREVQRNYLIYRERLQATDPTPAIDWEMLKLGASDLMRSRGGKLSWAEFREEVGKTMHTGDTHAIPEVAAAARSYRRMFDHVKQLGMDEDVFTVEARRELARQQNQLSSLLGAARQAVEARIQQLQTDIARVQKAGPDLPPNAKSYFPLIVRQDKIDANIAGFKQVLIDHLRTKGLRGQALTEGVEALYKTIRAQDPYKRLQPDSVGLAKSLKSRELEIPVDKLFPYLELDADAVARQYVRAMSADIELTRKFGSPDMGERLDEIAANWREKIDAAAGNNPAILKLEKERDAALSDLRALRDRVRGTYGLPDEPYSVTAATLRSLKSFNYLTMMGGVVLSSLPDPVRVWMTEGFDRAFGAGLKTLVTEPAIFKAAAKEIQLAGEAMDAVLGGRAASFLDTSLMLGRSFPIERTLGVASEQMSFLNVLHIWTDIMKRWAGAVTGSRIVETSIKLSKGSATAAEIEKLARSGIDKPMAERIASQVLGKAVPYTPWTEIGAAETGKPITVKVYRGESGGAKVRVIGAPGAETAMQAGGVGTYGAPTEALARQYGKNVKEGVIQLSNPVIMRSEKDLLAAMTDAGIKNPEKLMVDARTDQYRTLTATAGDKIQELKEVRQAEVKKARAETGGGAAKLYEINQKIKQIKKTLVADRNKLAEESNLKFEEALQKTWRYLHEKGHDGLIVDFGDRVEWGQSILARRFTTNVDTLFANFNHSQVVDWQGRPLGSSTKDGFGTKGQRLFVAGSEDWTDEAARDAFRSALIADVNRTIVTPGFGDTPLWTSTQFGSTISQFKKFGMASMTRILISGLQENDMAFWSGALALVAAGGIASGIKDKLQYGHDFTNRPWQDQLLTAIDRSGLAGWFMDAHNSLEKLTDHRVGLHRILGDRINREASFASKIGATLGPSAQQAATLLNIGADLATLDYDKWTARNLRRLMPGQSLFWAQPFFDTMEDLAYPGPLAGRQQAQRFIEPPPGAF